MPATLLDRPRVQVVHHDSPEARWELANAAPAAPLRPFVSGYTGWWERLGRPFLLREMPTEIAPVIINFAAPTRIVDPRQPRRPADVGSFATGAFDGYVLVGYSGPSGGVQIDFTLLGARLFLGMPLRDLTNRIVALGDLLGADARRLEVQLYEAPSWDARFALLDREIGRRLLSSAGPSRAVRGAWWRLASTAGRASIAGIVNEIGCSQKHLIDQFRAEIGLPPKTVGRVLRFGQAVTLLRDGQPRRLADIAAACGYYDQAHFTRDAREFAGATPSELLRSLNPGTGAFAGEATQDPH
jgi:AraC-like DNA-binding protein